MSILFFDTDCELWYEKAEALGLQVIKMPYTLDGKEYYYDLGKNTDFKHFFERMRQKSMPTTAALNTYDYIEYFEPYLKKGEDIFYIAFSRKLSGTFEFVDKAIAELKEKYPERKITVFDTKSISMGAGISVYYAAKKWKEGATDKELLDFLNEFAPRVQTYFAVDDLFHLKRGGRLSGFAATAGTLLGVKPILKINEEGKIVLLTKEKGTKRAIAKLASLVGSEGGKFDQYDVYIIEADCRKEAEELKAKIEEATNGRANVVIQIMGPVIAAHCGPGTLGVIYYKA
jgi:DegV family protein with EDD domain